MRRLPPLALMLVLVTSAGCSFDSYDKPVRLYPDRHAAVAGRAPVRATYKTVVRVDGGAVHPFGSATVACDKGDRLGLWINPNGDVVASVDGMMTTLGPIGPEVKYVAWAHPERRSGFGAPPEFPDEAEPERAKRGLFGLLLDGIFRSVSRKMLGDDDDQDRGDDDRKRRTSGDRGERYGKSPDERRRDR